MAQGTRGRLALLGTGLLFCLGCMEPDPKPIGKPPLPKSQMGSTVKPNQPASNTTYGGGVQPAGFNTTGGRTNPNTGTNVPAQFGTGAAPAPAGVVPGISPAGFTGAPTPSNDPYAGGRPMTPTYPPTGYDAQPPVAPGGPAGSYPMAPIPAAGSVNPYGK